MQACEVCGWDTRAGTRVCASCRAGLESGDPAGDSVLAGVLQRAREMSAGDAGHPPEDAAGATTSRRPSGPRSDDDGREQVVLREIEPGGDEADRPRRSEPSSVAASLIEAFQSPQDIPTRVDASTAPDGPRTGTVDDLPPTGPDEVEDDATAGSVDRTPTADPVEPIADTDRLDAVTRPPAGDGDVVGERVPDASGVTGASPATTGPRARADEPSPAWASPEDAGPITDRFANIPTVPMEPGPSPDLSRDPPTEAADATSAPPAAAGEIRPTPARDDGPTTAQAPADARTASTTTADGQGTSDTPAWRAALREAGTWTAVAQFTLLFIGMLCVFQVVVLLVVNQFLSQAQTQQAVAADMLAAHAKVATVMLPALVGGAFAAAAFAAWRAHTDPQQHDDDAPLRRWVLGLPVAIWAVIVTATVLLVVVLLGTSATVAGAQRMTLWAIGACTLLCVACVAAPRGLAAVEDADADEAPRADAARC
jgi:hypothetical protein